ncbi:MAG: SDR family oxidoreductase [Bacteroidota bacterium]
MSQKVILITGTSSGFGKLTAEWLAEKGHKVYASMRNTTSKNAEVAQALSAKDNIQAVELDVTNVDSVNQAVQHILDQEGQIDVLINNAGGGGVGFTESYTIDDVKKQYDVNVFGVFNVTKAVLPGMRKRRDGLVINISSIMGRFTAPLFAMYCSSKFALEAMSEAWSYEWKSVGVDSVVVEPGAFPTTSFPQNMINFSPADSTVAEDYGDLASYPQRFGEMLQGQIASGEYNKPELVAEAIEHIIGTPKGERPIRMVVDPATEGIFNPFNEKANELQQTVLTAFGMIQPEEASA